MPTPLEALLNRPLLHFDPELIRARVRGKRVLVTGAAGSIGSEISRQLAALAPDTLIGLDNAETPLFNLNLELPALTPEIGDITRPHHLESLFRRHQPQIVFHAAAFKHVPMMELHPFAAVETNLFGTQELAQAAIRHHAEDLLLISSDKAVRPTSIMGATKRLAEILIHALAPTTRTRFYSVRFGNVLGSSGSVVPIFQNQIANGGPITITHPEMRRYFMTTPEATELVLLALALGRGGELFTLDMGQPIRILDLAERMIRLAGLEPGRDIKIQFTGIRPGEKLFEELNLHSENLLPTPNPRILCHRAIHDLNPEQIHSALHQLRRITAAEDRNALIGLLKQLIPDFVQESSTGDPGKAHP